MPSVFDPNSARNAHNLKVYNGVADLAANGVGFGAASVVTIGNFDGVHRGHQALLGRTIEIARAAGVPAVVLTFEPHPLAVLKPELKLKRLFDADDRKQQFATVGIDTLVVEPFSRSFSQMTPEQFLNDILVRPFRPRAIVVGYDFSFGANRSGSIDFLRSHSAQHGFTVEVVAPVAIRMKKDGLETTVSSTRIRAALAQGAADEAKELLGRPYVLRGVVRKGAGRGRTIGIPTANLEPTVESAIQPGVYAAWVKMRERFEMGLVNIGRNPTFVDSEVLHIEAHLPQYDGVAEGDLYGEFIELHFEKRIRDEKKFGSVSELTSQIRHDIESGIRLLQTIAAPEGER